VEALGVKSNVQGGCSVVLLSCGFHTAFDMGNYPAIPESSSP
jgi:hypothetical protein